MNHAVGERRGRKLENTGPKQTGTKRYEHHSPSVYRCPGKHSIVAALFLVPYGPYLLKLLPPARLGIATCTYKPSQSKQWPLLSNVWAGTSKQRGAQGLVLEARSWTAACLDMGPADRSSSGSIPMICSARLDSISMRLMRWDISCGKCACGAVFVRSQAEHSLQGEKKRLGIFLQPCPRLQGYSLDANPRRRLFEFDPYSSQPQYTSEGSSKAWVVCPTVDNWQHSQPLTLLPCPPTMRTCCFMGIFVLFPFNFALSLAWASVRAYVAFGLPK